jgi:hypothetical protein
VSKKHGNLPMLHRMNFFFVNLKNFFSVKIVGYSGLHLLNVASNGGNFDATTTATTTSFGI